MVLKIKVLGGTAWMSSLSRSSVFMLSKAARVQTLLFPFSFVELDKNGVVTRKRSVCSWKETRLTGKKNKGPILKKRWK
jgi:hypothetical protein